MINIATNGYEILDISETIQLKKRKRIKMILVFLEIL